MDKECNESAHCCQVEKEVKLLFLSIVYDMGGLCFVLSWEMHYLHLLTTAPVYLMTTDIALLTLERVHR